MLATLFQDMPGPVTGYLLCYIPLAAVIIGLITLFVITDRHASRPYLRYNPFVAAGASDQEIAQRPPAVGETPAGSLGGAVPAGEKAVFLGEYGATTTVPEEEVPPPATSDRPASLSGAPPTDAPKDLGRVTGIDLPNVDQSPSDLQAPPTEVAPPSAAELPSATPPSQPAVERPAAVPPGAPAVRAAAGTAVPITYIEFNPAGGDRDGEYVRIENNTGSPITMTGWTLRDAGGKHSFAFPAFTLAPGAAVQLWSTSGTNDAANLYWGQRGAVWNNTGDTAILLDASGNEVSRFSYTGRK